MIDFDTRRVILKLHRLGHGISAIASAVHHSRNAVRGVILSGVEEVAQRRSTQLGVEHLERIRELYHVCAGNRVRVHEELAAEGVRIEYSTLTGLCRRHGIGVKEKQRAGAYHFEPGQEMQHDTSPHDIVVGGKQRRWHCASLVLCFSRRIYAQVYPRWNRFSARIFLTEALLHFGAVAKRCMIDNSSVIIAHGRGADAVAAAEMQAFARRFGFYFRAHELGDANRSARVERPFRFIETNFYPGRSFTNLTDLNAQLLPWCGKSDAKPRRKLGGARPIDLFATEQSALGRLPIHVPEIYRIFNYRSVDEQGYVHLHTNRYSVPNELLEHHDVELRESKDRVRIFLGHREICSHQLADPGANQTRTLPEHQHYRRKRKQRQRRQREARELTRVGPELEKLVVALEKKHGGRAGLPIRRLHALYLDYPNEALLKAAAQALRYGLLDIVRIEKMVLRIIAGDFFPFLRDPKPRDDKEPGDE